MAASDPTPDPLETTTLPPRDQNTAPGADVPGAPTTPTLMGPQPGGPLPQDFGPYRLERLLGRGGMGAVYLAQDTQLGRQVALKIPFLAGPTADAVRARFRREARAAAALHHPNVCPIHAVGEIDGVPFLTMAFIEGEPLTRRLEPGRPFSPREAAVLVRKLALALAEAHARGVVHRDLKPGNVMIDARGEPILMDFGLARRADASNLTQQGEVMGTPVYMAPEQINGDVQALGPGTDVYSLGVVLYELLTGTLPFRGDLLSLVSQITLDEPDPPSHRRPGLDPRLDRICLTALAKRPEDRWRSMEEFAAALEPITQPPAIAAATLPAPAAAPLTLRIAGTPFAYRPLPGQDVITLGRQKRRQGDPDDHGNDVVLRVAGNDQLSTRISRRHLEIRRAGGHFVVVDRSKAGTLRNGQPLPRDVAVPLEAGDRLVVAGAIALEVGFQGAGAPTAPTEVEVPQPGGSPIIFEATLGDLVTLE
jgi:serine/threonine protein kinase